MVNRTALDAQTAMPGTRGPASGPFTRWPRLADAVVAVVVFVVLLLVSPQSPDGDVVFRAFGDAPVGELLVFVVASGVLWWRRSRSAVLLGITLVALTLSVGLGYSELVGIAMLVALYSVGRYTTDNQWSYGGLGAVLAFVIVSSVFDASTLADIGFGLVVTVLLWYIGRRLRIRGEYAAQLAREQAAEARRAVAEERTRIARELHDVVAHRVSLMTVQAGAAKTVAAVDPESAAQAMQAVEKAGRQALDELRHLLGVLRPEADAATLGPQPRLADVPRLVDQFRAAGLDVSLTMDGSAYRIVQEALTNALKHAGPSARTAVRLSTDRQEVAIEVLDDGRGATILTGSGHGIVGMGERALQLGGSLHAGPRPGGGFQVVARLPIQDEPA